MKLLVTGASGFLGSRTTQLLRERGHDVVPLVHPRGRQRSSVPNGAVAVDAGALAARDLMDGCDAVLHFAGVPDPASSARDPARAVRENAGTTLNLLEGAEHHGAGFVYPSTIRAGLEPPPDEYAFSKRLGELVCRLHWWPSAVVRLPSVFGPGQVALVTLAPPSHSRAPVGNINSAAASATSPTGCTRPLNGMVAPSEPTFPSKHATGKRQIGRPQNLLRRSQKYTRVPA